LRVPGGIGVTGQTYCRWLEKYGGLKVAQQPGKDLENENARLRLAISDLTLDKLILQEAAEGASEPHAATAMHRSAAAGTAHVGATNISGARATSIDASQGATRGGRRAVADWRHYRTGQAVRALRLSPVTASLADAGRAVKRKRVERIWRKEGFKGLSVSQNGVGCGSMTDPAFGSGRNILGTSGGSTSCSCCR
jgi:hypothetical protein